MKKLIFVLGIISGFAFASVGMAVPTLQLDIDDGWYDQPSESVVTASGDFTLYALLTLNGIEGGTATKDGGDLPGHDVFPTQFMEYEFQFSAADSTGTYNVQGDPGTFGTHTGNDTYFVAFNFTGTDLDGDYNLHFDLYNTQLKTKKALDDIDAYLFAPFSHDAQRVPEPGTLVLLGIGILGVAVYRRKMS